MRPGNGHPFGSRWLATPPRHGFIISGPTHEFDCTAQLERLAVGTLTPSEAPFISIATMRT